MSQIPFYLVSGFLGSGKTTFLKRILDKNSGAKIAIVQNEFAPTNIDGAELRNEGFDFEILEINNGSVFCVCLLNDFIGSLSAFVDQHHPDIIFLEASGLSDPIAIAQMLDFKELKKRLFLARIWTIVDSSQFLKQTKLITRLQHQVRVADTLIINKTDLSTQAQIEAAEKEIRALNPFANIVHSKYCEIPDNELELAPKVESFAIRNKEDYRNFESCKRPDIGVGILKSTRAIEDQALKQFIEHYSRKTIRMKGFAKLKDDQFVAIQSSFENIELRKIDSYKGPTEIIAMGHDFNLSEFSRKFRELAV